MHTRICCCEIHELSKWERNDRKMKEKWFYVSDIFFIHCIALYIELKFNINSNKFTDYTAWLITS